MTFATHQDDGVRVARCLSHAAGYPIHALESPLASE